MVRIANKNRICKIQDCGRTVNTRGWCSAHYHRWRRYGDPTAGNRMIERVGSWRSPTYKSWQSMKERCYNPNSAGYLRYGGRGISVFDRWINSFAAFEEDLGDKPSSAYSLERINVNGDYEPGNCRWATALEQAHNRGPMSNNTSGYRGVRWDSVTKKWRVSIQYNHKRFQLGRFRSKEDAAWVYDQWALQLIGNHAPTNLDYN